MIRVVLADDHAVVRKGIRQFLEEDPDIEVVAEAGDGVKVQDLILELDPDVAVLDIRMPYITGIQVVQWIQAKGLRTRALILSAYDDDPFVISALQAGASGYVLKNAEAEEITSAVHSVHHGHSALSGNVAQKLMSHVTNGPAVLSTEDLLTDREIEVLQHVSLGLTNRAIGLKLSISERTAQGHLASVYSKLQVSSRTEAVTKALQMGWIHLADHIK